MIHLHPNLMNPALIHFKDFVPKSFEAKGASYLILSLPNSFRFPSLHSAKHFPGSLAFSCKVGDDHYLTELKSRDSIADFIELTTQGFIGNTDEFLDSKYNCNLLNACICGILQGGFNITLKFS